MENLVEGVRWLFDLAQERIAGEVRYHGGYATERRANLNRAPCWPPGVIGQLPQRAIP